MSAVGTWRTFADIDATGPPPNRLLGAPGVRTASVLGPRVNLSQGELWTAIQRGLCDGGKSLHDCG